MRTMPPALLAAALAALVCAGAAGADPPVADPRRVVCVSGGNDAFTSGAEGYYRSLPALGADSIQVGGDLFACMNYVRKGDRLVVIAHGLPGTFTWSTDKSGASTTYGGYGTSTGFGVPAPVPPTLMATNAVTVTLVGCFSANDPDGSGEDYVSVAETLRDQMDAGRDPDSTGNRVSGYNGTASVSYDPDIKGGTEAQKADAEAFLKENGDWTNNPPSNRTPAPTPPARTQTLAAGDTLATAFQGKGLTVNLTYKEPKDTASEPGGGAPHLLAGPYCEVVIIEGPEPTVFPGTAPIGLVSLGLLLATAAITGLVRRRAGDRA